MRAQPVVLAGAGIMGREPGRHKERFAMAPGPGNATRCVVAICFLLYFLHPAVSAAETPPWLPITQQDLQMKDVKGFPGAEAVQLYYADEIDDTAHTEFLYRRIKILNELGKRYADVEIPMVSKMMSLSDFSARTIHPDGSITEFDGKLFEKLIFKDKAVKVLAQTFTFSQVTPGSIIEYKYTVKYPERFVFDHRWTVEHDLFTVKEHFWFKYNKLYSISWVAPAGLQLNAKPQPGFGAAWEMDEENVLPFQAEEQMPPKDWYRVQVKFFYTDARTVSSDTFWSGIGHYWSLAIEKYLGNYKEIRRAAKEAIGGEGDPEKKLRALYSRAQQIRNLTYERDRTEKEQKKEELKENKNVADVVKRGYGNRNDITRFFVAMARAGGFDSSIVFVSSRASRLFEKDILLSNQLDSEIAVVRLGGKSVFLDPGTPFCPYGLVRWMRTGTTAMDSKAPGVLFSIPGAGQDSAVTVREASVVLAPDGALKGEITLRYTGGEALEHRLAALDTDDAGRTRELEEELKNELPANAIVKLTGSKGWNKEDEPLSATFAVQVPAYASSAGNRLLVPAGLFQKENKLAFNEATRKYPIYFPYAFAEEDSVTVQVPEGYYAESVPAQQEAKLPYAKYIATSKSDAKRLIVQRTLEMNAVLMHPRHYPELKDFFSRVRIGDEAQAVLRQTGGGSKGPN